MSASIVKTLRAAGCVFAEDETRLLVAAAGSAAELDSMVGRRASGLPLEHILGWTEFCGLRVAVEPGVFVPRRRTELLVHEAVRAVRPGGTVVDLGCGTGAIGAALRSKVAVALYAVDIDPVAVKCAARNLDFPDAVVLVGDLYSPLPDTLQRRVDVITANTPYVPTGAIALLPAEARLHEPYAALDGGADGLDIARRVVSGARLWLADHGQLLIETSDLQAALVAEEMRRHRLTVRIAQHPESNATVVIGQGVHGEASFTSPADGPAAGWSA